MYLLKFMHVASYLVASFNKEAYPYTDYNLIILELDPLYNKPY